MANNNEKTQTPKLSWLIGRGVFNPDASFVGRIVAVRAEGDRPVLLTQQTFATAVEIGWDKIAGGKDIVILKPGFDPKSAQKVLLPLNDETRKGWDVGTLPKSDKETGAPEPADKEPPVCPTCGLKARWVKEYSRWYCRWERKYL